MLNRVSPAVVMFAGPSGTGKSTLIELIRDGKASADLARLLPPGMEEWALISAAELRRLGASDALHRLARNGGLILHYDYIKARLKGVSDFLNDPVLQIFLAGSERTLVNIVPEPDRLVAQFNSRNAPRLAHLRERRGAARHFIAQTIRVPLVQFLWRLGLVEQHDIAALYASPGYARESIDRWSGFVRNLTTRYPSIRRIDVEPADQDDKPCFRLLPTAA